MFTIKESGRLYLSFVGKMDKQAQLRRKREQRHRRETSSKLDKTICEYVKHKYPGVYAEAKERYDELNSMYPSKKDLTKTVEHSAWKKQIQRQRSAKNKEMELKIQLMRSKKTTTTTTTTEIIESSSSTCNEISTSPNDDTSTAVNASPVNDETSTAVNASPVNDETSTALDELDLELDQITPFINEEIPPKMIEEIMNELKRDKDLNEYLCNILPDDDDDVDMFE